MTVLQVTEITAPIAQGYGTTPEPIGGWEYTAVQAWLSIARQTGIVVYPIGSSPNDFESIPGFLSLVETGARDDAELYALRKDGDRVVAEPYGLRMAFGSLNLRIIAAALEHYERNLTERHAQMAGGDPDYLGQLLDDSGRADRLAERIHNALPSADATL